MPRVAALIVAAVVLAVCATSAHAASTPCSFNPPIELNYWAGSPGQVSACFGTIPFNETRRSLVMEVVKQVFDAYSFGDLQQAPVGDYMNTVDWPTILNDINTTSYASEFPFYRDLSALFNQLGDAHIVYYGPHGYGRFFITPVFSLETRYVGGAAHYFAAPGYFPASYYSTLCECSTDLAGFYGLEVTEIDGFPVATYIANQAPKLGYYNDLGVQTNYFLSADGFGHPQYLSYSDIPESDLMTFKFAGNTSADTFSLVAWSLSAINSASDITSANVEAKRDGFEQDSIAALEDDVLAQLLEVSSSFKRGTLALSVENAKRIADTIDTIQTTKRQSEAFGANVRRAQYSESIPLPHVRLSKVSKALSAIVDIQTGFDRAEYQRLTKMRIDAAVAAMETETTVTKRTVPEVPIITGDKTLFTDHSINIDADYWTYNGTTILRLSTFSPGSLTDFHATIKAAHQNRVANGANENLIIDLSNNGGGIVCLNYGSLAYLIASWTNRATSGDDILYSPYDFRLSPLASAMNDLGAFPGTDCINPATGAVEGPAFYTSPVQRSYGSHTSSYTQKFNWDLCGSESEYWFPADATPYHFDKIILITDGRCGSSCSYFLTHLRNNDKVRVVSYGGLDGHPLATSSFAGGNVLNWGFISSLNVPSVPVLPDNSYTSFNFRENFNAGGSIPRQFLRLEADFHLSLWDPLQTRYDTSSDALATLYSSVLPLFENVPAGLPRANPTTAPSATIPVGAASSVTPAVLLLLASAFLAVFF